MNDRPTAAELIDAARLYLEKELLPALTDARQRFQTLVAANVLAIAARELGQGEGDERAAVAALVPGEAADLRALNERLCAAIRTGAFDDPVRFAAAMDVVRRQVVCKLEVANPKYLQAVTQAAAAPGR